MVVAHDQHAVQQGNTEPGSQGRGPLTGEVEARGRWGGWGPPFPQGRLCCCWHRWDHIIRVGDVCRCDVIVEWVQPLGRSNK